MSIEIRKVNGTNYVTETRRVGGKVVKTHLGKLEQKHAEFLYRTSQLQSGVRKRLRAESLRSRGVSEQVADSISLLLDFAEHRETLSKLQIKLNWKRNPMNDTTQPNSATDRVKQAIDILPSKHEFAELCRQAELGDPDAIETFERVVEQTPELLDSVADLVELAKALIIQDVSANSHLMKLGIENKLSNLLKSLKASGENDPITLMNTEILVVSYLDAMRCGLLAVKQYDTASDAERFLKLAERSPKRFERAQAMYFRHLQTKA